jgi:hypothetical protein
MSTIGVNFQIDFEKLDKLRFHKGKKGTYGNFTLFLNSDPDQYGQNGGIKQADTKEERDAGIKLPFVGNAKTFWSDNPAFQPVRVEPAQEPAQEPATDEFDDSIPF